MAEQKTIVSLSAQEVEALIREKFNLGPEIPVQFMVVGTNSVDGSSLTGVHRNIFQGACFITNKAIYTPSRP